MKSILPILLSFALAFAAGWFGMRDRVRLANDSPVGAPISRATAQRPAAQALTADGLIAKLTAKQAEVLAKNKTTDGDWQRIREEQKQKFDALKASFVLDGDPAKQYQAALERFENGSEQWAEAQLILLAWLRQDTDGLLAFLAKSKHGGLSEALTERCHELSREQTLELLGKLEQANQPDGIVPVLSQLVASTLAGGKFEDAIALADQFMSQPRSDFLMRLAIECPDGLKADAFKWFVAHGENECVRQMASQMAGLRRLPNGQLVQDPSWLQKMTERYPETREAMVKSGIYQGFMMAEWTKMPLQEGLAAMVAGMPDAIPDEAKRTKAMAMLCTQAVDAALGSLRTRQQAVGDEPVSMDQLVELMGPKCQELYAAAPAEMGKAIFPKLAMQDPVAALRMVGNLDPKAREQLVLKAAAQPLLLVMGDAERLLGLFDALPPNAEQGPLQARFMAWNQITNNAYHTHGDSYPAWLLALPNSVNRDMALSALAMSVKGTDPELAAHLQAAKSLAPPSK